MIKTELSDQTCSELDLLNDEKICPFPPMDETTAPRAFAVDAACRPVEGNAAMGTDVSWRTLISSDCAPSNDFVLGIAEILPAGLLPAHRHQPAEFYLGLRGSGIVIIEGMEYPILAGVSIFIPENYEHSVLAGSEGLSFAYGFARDSFAEIHYELSISDRKHA